MTINRVIGLSMVISLTFLLMAPLASAEDVAGVQKQLMLKMFSRDLNMVNEIKVFESDFQGIMDFTLLDLGNDGVNEIAAAYGHQARPAIKLFRADGSLINQWFPYGVGYEGKVAVAAGDLNNDGAAEIITGTGDGGGPHIRIFDGYGVALYNGGFFADEPGYRQGTELAIGDVNNDGRNEIAVSLKKNDKNVIKFFDVNGQEVLPAIERTVSDIFEPSRIFLYDVDNDNDLEIIVGACLGEEPRIRVLELDGRENFSFLAYGPAFKGGLDIAAGVINGQEVIVAGAGYSGGPHVRFFDLQGKVVLNPAFFAYDSTFRGGLNVAAGSSGNGSELAVMPLTASWNADFMTYGKLIVVDISEQRLYAYNHGKLERSFYISSGTYKYPTPYGNFAIYKKRPVTRMSWVYGPGHPDNYDLPGVKWAMAFYGAFNLHGTYWHHNFGRRMSHGCVNISNSNAEWLYNWSPIGTKVRVQK